MPKQNRSKHRSNARQWKSCFLCELHFGDLLQELSGFPGAESSECSICFFCDVIAAIAGHIPKL